MEYSQPAADAKVVFLTHCYDCHSHKNKQDGPAGGVHIMNNDNLVLTRKVVVPGQPEKSEVYGLLLLPEDANHVMPPADRQPRMTKAEIEKVRLWIADGAKPFPKTRKVK